MVRKGGVGKDGWPYEEGNQGEGRRNDYICGWVDGWMDGWVRNVRVWKPFSWCWVLSE